MITTPSIRLRTALLFLSSAVCLGFFTGCETTSGGSSPPTYDASVYDPWYYGDYHDDVRISLPPGAEAGPRPSHPIAMPPSSPRPSPRR
jgi:hypothetical protein